MANMLNDNSFAETLADYILLRANTSSEDSWSYFPDVFPSEDEAWAIAIGDYCGPSPSFPTFRGLSTGAVVAILQDMGGAFGTPYAEALWVRVNALSLDEFAATFPADDQAAIISLFDTLVANATIASFEDLLALKKGQLANEIAALTSSHDLVTNLATSMKAQMASILADYPADDDLRNDYSIALTSAFTNEFAVGTLALLDEMIADLTLGGFDALPSLSTSTLAAAIADLGSGHRLVQGIAGWVIMYGQAHSAELAIPEPIPTGTLSIRFASTSSPSLPLVGYLAEVTDARYAFNSVLLAATLTDSVGMIKIEFPIGDESADVELDFVLTEFGTETTYAFSHNMGVFVGVSDLDILVTITAPASTSQTFLEIESATGNSFPGDLKTYLTGEGYANLEDIRIGGGIAHRADTAVTENLAQAARLDAHAQLELISDDAEMNEYLITQGFDRLSSIAAMSRKDFVEGMSTGAAPMTQALALRYWNGARKVSAFLQANVMGHIGDLASASQSRLGDGITPEVGGSYIQTFGTQCDCPECSSGVSPLAYLASLLDYAQKYIKDGSTLVDADQLQVLFKHPYCELPADCASGTEEVCQVRVAVEVLRQHLSGDASWALKRPYMEQAYRLLLTQAGTSLEELRRVATQASDGEKARLADRLGILPSEMEGLYLDVSLTYLTEHNLEKLFGLQDTMRHPLSAGAKEGDSGNDVYSWRFGQVMWNRNTDEDGWVYLDIAGSSIQVFRDSGMASSDLVATGILSASAPWTIQLNPVDDYGLTGRIELTGSSVVTDTVRVSVIPRILAWRLKGLRRKWMVEDWPNNGGYFDTIHTPFIDPDVVDAADFRGVTDGSSTPDSSQPVPFQLWSNRKLWVHYGLYEAIKTQLGSGDLDGALGFLSAPITYYRLDTSTVARTPWDLSAMPSGYVATDIEGLFAELRTNMADSALNEAAQSVIQDWLRMSNAAWVRLEALEARYRAGVTTFTDAEAADIVAILAQSAKRTFFPDWASEENTEGILLSTSIFWSPILAPRIGSASLKADGSNFGIAEADVPFIDPDLHAPIDLQAPGYGASVHNTYALRAQNLATLRSATFAKRKQTGVSGTGHEEMWDEAYPGGNLPAFPGTLTSMAEVLDYLNYPIGSTERTTALTYVLEALCLTEDEFREIMESVLREIANVSVLDSDYLRIAHLMVTGFKRAILWSSWASDETSATLYLPWIVYRANLSEWAGGTAQRAAWEAALAHNTRVPMADPDIVGPGDFFDPEYRFDAALDNPAFALWWIRNNGLNGSGGWLDTIAGDSIAGNLTNEIGTDATELADLNTLFEQGVDVGPRLRQLGLSTETLYQLANISSLVTLTTADRDVFNAIVLDVKRRRSYGEWNNAERAAEITLGPDLFEQPYQHAGNNQAYVDAVLRPWRGRMAERRAWEDRLQARIDQHASLEAGHRNQVQAVEGDALRTLRDILIMKDATGQTLETRADEFSARLLTDMRTACCQRTTRVAAAIETLQQLFHGLRTAQLPSALSSLSLANDPVDFDADWRWLGSYANWRGLMFVYLYPENLLMPSLRAHRTGTFAGIVELLRNNPRLRPDMVCGVMKEYETYLADLHSLRVGASVTTTVYSLPDGCGSAPGTARNLTYLFARGGDSMQVYWSSFDTAAGANMPQTLWEPVPEMARIHRIVGAFVYEIQNGERYLYIMGIRHPEGREQPVLVGNRYHLGNHRWQSDLEEFEAPVNPWTWVISERKDERESPVFGAVNYEYPSVYEYGDTIKINISSKTGYTLRNRSMFFGRLNPEGVTWQSDDFGKIEINWIHGYRPVAMIQTMGKVVVIGETNWNGSDHTLTYLHWRIDGTPNPLRFFKDDLNGANFSSLATTDPAAYAAVMLYTSNTSQPGDKTRVLKQFLPSSSMPYQFAGLKLINYLAGSTNPSGFHIYYYQGAGSLTTRKLIEVGVSDTLLIVSNVGHDYFNSAWVGPCMQHVRNATAIPTSMAIQPRVNGIPIQLQIDNPYTLIVVYVSPTPGVIYSLKSEGTPGANRRNAITQLFQNNQFYSPSNTYPSGNPNLVYLEEAYYHLPMLLALELQKQKFYVEALDMYRLVFDYSQAVGQRKIFYGLIREESLSNLLQNVFAWLDEPENPHTVAAQRANSYTRFTIFSLVRCLLDYADQEYTRDTSESVPRAKMLYETATRLLNEEFFVNADPDCAEALAGLDVQVQDATWLPVWIKLRERIAATNDHDLIHRMLDGFATGGGYVGLAIAFADTGVSAADKIAAAETAFQIQLNQRGSASDRLCTVLNQYSSSQWNLSLLGSGVAATGRMAQILGKRGTESLEVVLSTIIQDGDIATIDWLDGESASGTVPQARASAYTSESGHWVNQYENDPLGHLQQSGVLKTAFIPYSNHYFCVPRNPVPEMLRLHAELNLYKIRHCMNIAGIKRSIEPYAAATDSVSGMPIIGAGGQIMFPGAQSVPSTGYRFEFLLAKAKELSQYAQQLESALLSSLEKRDAEHYSLMKARQDVKIARASVRLQDLRISEAESGITLAEMQRDRSQVQIDGLQDMIDEGLNGWEKMQIAVTLALEVLTVSAHTWSAFAEDSASRAIAIGLAGISGGASITAHTIASGFRFGTLAAVAAQSAAESSLSIAGIQASFERRKQEWQFSKVLAYEDLKIGGQQVRLAQDRLRVVGQERHISQMQMDHADATVDFLLNKFTNAELYDWMSRVLEGVYGYFLQQATAMAKLAQQQLAFERQVAPPSIVQDDYWYPSSENVNFEAGEGTRVDRKGLTGSTRLFQDITRLDLYAIETLRRKHQLTRSLSLAQLFPAEFSEFRKTGVMTFRTPMEIFDRDFPGHYLRLIRKVRTTVVALVPPLEGVKARLSTTGIARVVTGPEVFQTNRQTRGSESVALSSGYNDSGLFELNPLNGELLNPFEGMGVDAIWEFRMDRRANPFDFDTVADVILQFEYTALESERYREEVLRQLGDSYSGEASLSLKYSFPDQWYDLHNASLTATPYRVKLPLSKRAFPSHLQNVQVQHATLVCVLKDGSAVDPTLIRLGLFKDTGAGLVGGIASPNLNGVASTRQRPGQNGGVALYSGNAVNWLPLQGKDAAGDWYLDMVVDPLAPANGQAMLQALFADEEVRDIQLIITYTGDYPA